VIEYWYRHGEEVTMHHLDINIVRSEALFVSAVQRTENPSAGQIQRAIAQAVRAFGSRGCAAMVAQEFGDHPETAILRMRWARQVVDAAFVQARPTRNRARPRVTFTTVCDAQAA
jgi:hypothetical protein